MKQISESKIERKESPITAMDIYKAWLGDVAKTDIDFMSFYEGIKNEVKFTPFNEKRKLHELNRLLYMLESAIENRRYQKELALKEAFKSDEKSQNRRTKHAEYKNF